MQGFFTFVLIVTTTIISYSQTVLLNNATNGTTVTTCSATFYDSGGPSSNYANNENYTITFCPNITGAGIQLNFPFANLQLGTGDQICFYDGTSTGAPSLGCTTPTFPLLQVQASAGNTSGCITVEFTSNNIINGDGWLANVSCTTPCQTILSQLTSSSPIVDTSTGTIDICMGESVILAGQGSYPQNNTIYAQSDATSTFVWKIDGQVYNGQAATHTFNNPGGFRAQLEITDVNGCENTNLLSQEIRVSGIPSFSNMTIPQGPFCAGDTLGILLGEVVQSEQDFAVPFSVGDSIFLPDGNGTSYTTSVSVNDFIPGQTMIGLANIMDICVNMEHSYMGDLNIEITCPTGQTIILHQYPGGGGTYLGIPVDADATPLLSGVGFDYCWEDPSTAPTWTAAAGVGTLPAGSYSPSQSFQGLVGCELNGDWTITITDNLSSDNGFIFNWGINFDPNIYPSLAPFMPDTDTTFWVQNAAIDSYFGDTAILAVPILTGNANYIFSTVNSFGCEFDTILSVEVLPFTNLNCVDCDSVYAIVPMTDTTICLSDSVPLDATVQSNISESMFTYTSGETVVSGNTVEAELNITGIVPGTVTAASIISVCIDAEHLFPADFDMFLVAPSGQVLELSTDNGGFSTNPNTYPNTCFTPTATNPINSATATSPFNGTYAPEGSFNSLNGATVNGIWKLQITDDGTFAIDGILNSWSITFNQTHTINHTWTPTAGLSCINCPNPMASPSATTEYVVNINDNFGCAKTDTVIVNVTQPLQAPVVSCGNTTGISIEINWTAVPDAISYEVNINNGGWIPANGILSHLLTSLVPSQTVTFQVRASQGSCDANNPDVTVVCITDPCLQTISLDSLQMVSCFSENDGVGFVSTTGSQPPFNFTLNGTTTQTSGTFTALIPGNYEVIAVDGFGCSDTVNFVITQPDSLLVTGSITDNICFGESNGSITTSVTGGNVPYSYDWSNGSLITNINPNLPIGNYILTVTDVKGCLSTTSYMVNEPTDIALSIGKTDVLCFNENSGSAFVIATGGTGIYNYTWDSAPIQTVDSAVGLPIGTYEVIVSDVNGCLDSISATINQPTLLTSTITTTNVSCFGFNSGLATISTGGGIPNYTYNWSTIPVQDSSTAINLIAGTYSVTATDANACSNIINFVITEPDTLVLTSNITNNICFGESNGIISVAVTGGTLPYSFLWSNGSLITNTNNNLSFGNYSLTVTDAKGCQISATYTISQPTDIALSIGKTDVLCFNENSGSAFVTATGGTGIYNYTWDSAPIQNVDSAVGLPIGTYEVIVSDVNGCLDSISTTINQPTALTTAITTTTDASCFGFNDGFSTVTIGGGTPSYTYNWSTIPAQDSSTAINLVAGTYYVTATDANGCLIFDTVTINQPTEITMTFTTTQVTCFGLSDGSATVFPAGGVGSTYQYAWNTTSTQNLPAATNLPGGIFEVTITDSTNCAVSDTIYVYAPVVLDLDTLYATPTLCFGSNEGTAGVGTSGGTGQKTYIWNTNPISNSTFQTNLYSGIYAVTATDQQGCQLIDSILVAQPDSLEATFVTDSLTCFQSSDGSTIVSITGGTMSYLYNWENSQSGTQSSNLSSGFTQLTVTDANSCVLVDSVFIPEPLLVTAVLSSTQVSCNGNSDGTTTAIPSGGTLPYTYNWTDTQTTQTAINLGGGFISVTITDSYGCLGSDSVSVLEYPTLATTDTSFQISCIGLSDGTAIALPSGGTGTYSYQWQSLIPTTDTVGSLAGGMYYYTITDSDNCTVSDSVSVFEPTSLTSTMNSVPVSCTGNINGSATINPTGGTVPYFYTWASSPQTTQTVFGLAPGFAYVTVTDLYNCQILDTVQVGEPTPVTATSVSTPTSCFNGSDGTATATGAGGVGNYTYNWIGQSQTTQTAVGLAAGSYIVEVADSNNCSIFDTIIVTQPTPLAMIPSISGASCFGNADGAVGVTPVGGFGPYSYQWSSATTDTLSSIVGILSGTYTVTITDFKSCTLVDSFFVPQPPMLILISNSTPVNCNAGSDGSAFINVSGGTSPYSYSWNSTAANSDSITNLPFGNYEVTVTDVYGCQIADTISVTEPTVLNLALSQQPSSCYGVNDGEAYVVITGGTLDYTILWNNTPTGVTDSIAYLTGDEMYIVTVTDGNSCVAIDSVFVQEPDLITAQVVITDETCFTSDDGIAAVVINGGTAPFSYDWGTNANNQTTQTATNLASGVYTVLISDVNNCNTQATGVVNQPDSLQARLTKVDIDCHGDATGSATVTAIGGVGGYTFSWQTNSGIQSGNTVINLVAGVHAVVTVTDANGCETTDQIIITQPDAPLTATIVSEDVDCYGDRDGRIEITTTGGTLPYEYTFDNNSPTTTNIFIGLDEGNYDITVEDANGCTILQQANITQPDEIIVDLGADILLEDGEQAILEANITNGFAPFIYVWQPADSLLSCADCPRTVVANIIFDKRYDLIVTDANGCTGESFVIIRTKKTKDIFVANAFTPNDDGNNDFLFVQGNPYVGEVKTFRVFDRWGDLVYESINHNPNDQSFGWDGTMKNQPMNAGVFVWMAEIEFADGDVKVYQGSAVLIR